MKPILTKILLALAKCCFRIADVINKTGSKLQKITWGWKEDK